MKYRRRAIAALVVAASLVAGGAVYNVARVRPCYGPQRFDVGSGKYVALTIDDGPDSRFTTRILDLLREKDAHATFFVVGDNVRAQPDLARREVIEGHELANHTMTHPFGERLTYGEARNEIARNQATIRAVTGTMPTLFRPPRGRMSPSLKAAVHDAGLLPVHWSVCLENKRAGTPERMADRVADRIKPGSVILMHDGRLDRSASVKALSVLLERLTADGYRVVSLKELMALHERSIIDSPWADRPRLGVDGLAADAPPR